MEKAKSEKKELKLLYEIIQTVSYNLDLKEVLSRIVQIVSSVTKADSCFLYLIDGGNLVLRASLNPKPLEIGNIKMKIGEGIAGWAAQKQKTIAVAKEAYKDKRFKFFNSLPEDKFEAILSVPIIYRDKILGVINVQHSKPKKYSKTEIVLFELVAKATGGAIDNALLFSEKEALKEALEIRKLIERAKGILMKDLNISEEEAYRLLHKKSMDKRLSLKEVANAIIISSDIKAKR
ncbi:MAG: GAF and ANTAR domain-containing protein [Candidatus Paceibacterota bacterium]|jgi:uroporphyrinogen-III synthase|nr:GAF and ANTAR domain-containing protein [Candidatus Paceibacterota bacterium]MDD4830527.1 GAF and ANTAR domain-containing protein [Candidatus Paceibacterota bacterium]MDD4874804.1 GAF and ANTAR domain-containing protein [Candidatus Paceibacterota bacterium]